MTGACPSDLKLEFHLLDPASSGLASHLAGCPGCRERLERMAGEGEEFRRFVYPATVDAVVRAARRRGTLRWLPALVPLAAAAGLAFFLWPYPRFSGSGYPCALRLKTQQPRNWPLPISGPGYSRDSLRIR